MMDEKANCRIDLLQGEKFNIKGVVEFREYLISIKTALEGMSKHLNTLAHDTFNLDRESIFSNTTFAIKKGEYTNQEKSNAFKLRIVNELLDTANFYINYGDVFPKKMFNTRSFEFTNRMLTEKQSVLEDMIELEYKDQEDVKTCIKLVLQFKYNAPQFIRVSHVTDYTYTILGKELKPNGKSFFI